MTPKMTIESLDSGVLLSVQKADNEYPHTMAISAKETGFVDFLAVVRELALFLKVNDDPFGDGDVIVTEWYGDEHEAYIPIEDVKRALSNSNVKEVVLAAINKEQEETE